MNKKNWQTLRFLQLKIKRRKKNFRDKERENLEISRDWLKNGVTFRRRKKKERKKERKKESRYASALPEDKSLGEKCRNKRRFALFVFRDTTFLNQGTNYAKQFLIKRKWMLKI